MPLGPVTCPPGVWTPVHDAECVIQRITLAPLWLVLASGSPGNGVAAPPAGSSALLLSDDAPAVSVAGLLPVGASVWARPTGDGAVGVLVAGLV